jgi:hypothetical protein
VDSNATPASRRFGTLVLLVPAFQFTGMEHPGAVFDNADAGRGGDRRWLPRRRLPSYPECLRRRILRSADDLVAPASVEEVVGRHKAGHVDGALASAYDRLSTRPGVRPVRMR